MIRKMIVIAWLLATFVGSAAAQENMAPQTKQRLAKHGYLLALKSKYACIRNSAIFQVMQYQTRYPQDDMRPFVKALRELSQNDPAPQNRLYAFLACTFLENEKLLQMAGVPPKGEDRKIVYFVRLQEILQNNSALASN
jgi:hypothetical protein